MPNFLSVPGAGEFPFGATPPGGAGASHRGQFGGVVVTSCPFPSVPMGLLTLIGCICAGLLAATAVALLVVAYRLGLLYRLLHKVGAKWG